MFFRPMAPRFPLLILGLAIGLVAAKVLPAAAQTQADQAYAERERVMAAHLKCSLFGPDEEVALEAARLQARGVLLRTDADRALLEEFARFARSEGERLDCDDPALLATADRLRSAFSIFRGTMHMTYQGRETQWTASRDRLTAWRVVQSKTGPSGQYEFGLFTRSFTPGRPVEMGLVLTLKPDAEMPSGAYVRLRDPLLAPEPWRDTLFSRADGLLTPPPNAVSVQVWASERIPILPDAEGLRRVVFIFPRGLRVQFEGLDPMDAFAIGLSQGRISERGAQEELAFDLGDYNAATLFASLPPI